MSLVGIKGLLYVLYTFILCFLCEGRCEYQPFLYTLIKTVQLYGAECSQNFLTNHTLLILCSKSFTAVNPHDILTITKFLALHFIINVLTILNVI